MRLSAGGLLEHARSHEGRKQIRYMGVAAVFVPLGQGFVQAFKWIVGMDEVLAVFVTACLLTIPNYLANKFLVWRHKDRDRMRSEVLVFWVAAILGTAFAMLFVKGAGALFPEENGALSHALAIFVGQLLGYGIVWVARYIFLDRLLFKATHHGEEPTPEELEDLHAEFPI